jgi:hypothetical protein
MKKQQVFITPYKPTFNVTRSVNLQIIMFRTSDKTHETEKKKKKQRKKENKHKINLDMSNGMNLHSTFCKIKIEYKTLY